MNNLKILCILIFAVFQSLALVAQDECDLVYPCEEAVNRCPQLGCENPVQVGHVFKPNNCRSAMEGILNRSARFAGLNDYRVNNDSRYCDQLQLAVDLNIGLIKSPATHWGTQSRPWWESMCHMVCEINQAYDCAGQRRPILEYMNLEVVDSGVEWYDICHEIKDIFADDIIAKYGNETFPHTHFHIDSIEYDNDAYNDYPNSEDFDFGVPDITKLQARMYMFYLAKKYIDCGFRAINLADVKKYTIHDKNNELGEYYYLIDLINKIKDYSDYKITVCGGPEILKVGNDFLFDYVELPYRTEESTDFFPEGSACGDDPLQAHIPEYPLEGCDLPDPSLTGISPDGCDGPLPILYKLDNYSGVVIEGGEPSESCYNTYGMDEATWWKYLSEECQIEFFEYYYCNQNDLDKKRYFEIPAMITPDSQLPDSLREKWLLTEHPAVLDAINAISEPVLMEPTVTKSCNKGLGTYCSVKKEWVIIEGKKCFVFKGKERNKVQYVLSVNNPDCSSTYGWSVQNPDGTWIGYHEEEEIIFTPTQIGTYRMFARQHNSAFENGSNVVEFVIEVEELICCNPEYSIINTFCPCIKLWPNVSNSMISVQFENSEDSSADNFNIEILNNYGSVVKTINNIPATTQQMQIEISDLDNGIHYLRSELCSEFNLEFVKF